MWPTPLTGVGCIELLARRAALLKGITMLESEKINPSTWADGYGKWHASVPLTGSRHSEAMAARKLILAELAARDTHPSYILKVTRERVTNHGTVVYGEDWL